MKEYKSSTSNWMQQNVQKQASKPLHSASESLDKIQQRRAVHGSPLNVKDKRRDAKQ